MLVAAILGYFGIETTSLAALQAGVGLAVGAAWPGLLGNFAAGAFRVIFHPYKVGDYVVGGGVEGTVTEVGLFNTIITSPDNVQTIVANSRMSGDVVKNFSAHPYRRVVRTVPCHALSMPCPGPGHQGSTSLRIRGQASGLPSPAPGTA